jgi:Neurotransmitter-gated ion-channel ligand binding domain
MFTKRNFAIICFLLFPFFSMGQTFRPSAGGVRDISLRFFLSNISEIKDMEESYTADFIFRLTWIDPSFKGRFKQTQILDPSKVNIPTFTVINERELRRTLGDNVQVDPDGTLSVMYRFTGKLSHVGDYSNFPFDKQKFRIIFVFGHKDYRLIIDPKNFGVAKNKFSSGWNFKNEKFFTETFYPAGHLPFPSAVFEIEGKRQIGYYIWKVFFPILLILIMAWGPFWIHPDELETRVNISVTANLTLIAYWFVLASMIPQISYFSKIDVFIIGSLSLVFLSFIAVIWTYRIYEKDKEKGEKVQEIFKWVHMAGIILITLYELAAIN